MKLIIISLLVVGSLSAMACGEKGKGVVQSADAGQPVQTKTLASTKE